MPVLLLSQEADAVTGRQQALYDHVAHDYDEVFKPHVAEHYLRKRTAVVRDLLPFGGTVLDVGAGPERWPAGFSGPASTWSAWTSQPGCWPRRWRTASGRSTRPTPSALPFEDGVFDLALSVATMHHLETPERVADTIAEMGRVVRPGGFVLIWDHNPLNPYWPILMKRVPQDHGDERLVSVWEILDGVRQAGLNPVRAARTGLVPDFMPAAIMPIWTRVEQFVEANPVLSLFAAHNVVVAQKP